MDKTPRKGPGVSEVLLAFAAGLLPWLLDKLRVFELISPPVALWLREDVSIPGWAVVTAVLLVIVSWFALWRWQSQRQVTAVAEPPAAPQPIAVPEVALSRAEKAVLAFLAEVHDFVSEDELLEIFSGDDRFTGPQISAALRSLRQKGLADYQLIDFVQSFHLTQAGFDTVEQDTDPG